jgi:hypothetical protein
MARDLNQTERREVGNPGRRGSRPNYATGAWLPSCGSKAWNGAGASWNAGGRAKLGLDEHADVFETDGMLAMRDLMELAELAIPELHDASHHPLNHPRLHDQHSIFHIFRDAGSILLRQALAPIHGALHAYAWQLAQSNGN